MIQGSINLDVKRVVGYRQFCNKLWNINKFALSNFPAGFAPEADGVKSLKLSLSDKWILTRLSSLIESTNSRFENWDFGYMVQGLYDFWLKELADYYIEAIKPVMTGNDEEAKKAALNTLYICLDSALRMLHPTMPYLTEELFQRLPHIKGTAPESITIAPFPEKLESFAAEGVEAMIANLQLTVSKFRSQFAALQISKQAQPAIFIRSTNPEILKAFEQEKSVFKSLIRSGEVTVLNGEAQDPEGCLKNFLNDEITIYVKVVGVIDIQLELDRIEKRNGQLAKLIEALEKKITMKGYEQKVPENVQKENSDKLTAYKTEVEENLKGAEDLKKFI